jgi:hypothetical protein
MHLPSKLEAQGWIQYQKQKPNKQKDFKANVSPDILFAIFFYFFT